MTNPSQASPSNAYTCLPRLVLLVVLVSALATGAQAQTYTVLHSFTGGSDGGGPYAGLSMDRGGNLYGTTAAGGSGHGTVFELSRRGSGWLFHPLYDFAGGNDGEGPLARVIFGPNGTLYGTTYAGGNVGCSGGYGCGTVFNLRPPVTICRAVFCKWVETVLYRFNGDSDAANPLFGDVIFDQAGKIYGTTDNGGGQGCGGIGCGTVFQLSPGSGGWSESVLYRFTGDGGDGANPYAGLLLDGAGNLYGTTKAGGPVSNGTIFQLSPSGSGWAESVLYGFDAANDGFWPVGGLIFDQSGNLIGATTSGGVNAGGIAFQFTRPGTEGVLTSFVGHLEGGVYGSLTMDAAGNLYGMNYDDGAYDHGSVFKLSPSLDGWTYTDIYDFTGGPDGQCPYGNVLIDAQGNLYGTAELGGQYGAGVVWEITP